MRLQESIRRILREETELGKYTKAVKVIVNDFKNEDFVCDIDVYYYADKYEVAVKIDRKEFEKKYENLDINYANILMTGYLDKLKRTIRQEIKNFLPVDLLIWFKKTNCDKSLNESENKKSGLLKAIEEDGLFQVIEDTGLTLPQIYTKTGELPREVLDRYIKDFIKHDGYHQTDGSVQLGYEVEIQTHVYTEHFYMKGDRVTVEIRRFDNRGQQTEGYIESLSNLTDEEIFNIVDDMTSWFNQNDL